MTDNVNSPSHYTQGDVEVIEVIEYITSKYPKEIRYHVGNIIKYICRAPFKGKLEEDINKSYWYLTRARKVLETESVKGRRYIVKFLPVKPKSYTLIKLDSSPVIDKFLSQTVTNYDKEKQVSIARTLSELNSNSGGDVQELLANVDYFLKPITT